MGQFFSVYNWENEVEDEQHFLLRCTLYKTLRRNLLKATALETNSLSDEDTFISLMSSQDCKIVKAMGTFVYCAFKEREQRNVFNILTFTDCLFSD